MLTSKLNNLRTDDICYFIKLWDALLFDETLSLADVLFLNFYQSVDLSRAFDDNILNLFVYNHHITVDE